MAYLDLDEVDGKMPRFNNLLKEFEPIQKGDENVYPESPRNWIADKVNGKTIPLADALGFNESIDIPKESLADQKQRARDFPEQMAGSTMGITRAVKELGPIAGKAINKIASEIPDLSPQAKHIKNIEAIRDFVEKTNLERKPLEIGEGFSQRVYDIPSRPEEVLKKRWLNQTPERTSEAIEDVIRDQLIFDKIGENAPNTNTYMTSKNAYQIQDKVKPLGYGGNALQTKGVPTAATQVLTKTDYKIKPEDLLNQNVGRDKTGNIKFFDVDNFDFPKIDLIKDASGNVINRKRSTPFTESDILNLLNSIKKPQNLMINSELERYLHPDVTKSLMNLESPNYINEILKLKGIK